MNVNNSAEANDHFMDFEEEFFRRRALNSEKSFSVDNEEEVTLDTTSSYSSNSFCAEDKMNTLIGQYRDQNRQLEGMQNDVPKKGSHFRNRLQSFGHRSSKSDGTKSQPTFRGLSPNINKGWKSFEGCSDKEQVLPFHRNRSLSGSNHARKRGNTIELGGFEKIRESFKRQSVESLWNTQQSQGSNRPNEDRRLGLDNDYLDSHCQRKGHSLQSFDIITNSRPHAQRTMDISEQYFLRMSQMCLKEGVEKESFETGVHDYNDVVMDHIAAFGNPGRGIHSDGYNLENGILVEKDDSGSLDLDDDNAASDEAKRPNQENLVADFIASDVLQRLDG